MESMSLAQRELWARILGFKFDDPHAAYPFSRRLARENGWSVQYTERVLGEYRRFLFLAMEAGHPVSPSEDVDEAWHLHLLYSRSYWDELCGRVLKKPLHHVPSAGGTEESHKFHDWYRQTLASYKRFFGADPPADIWPDASVRLAHPPEHVRVDRRRVWIIPRRVIPWRTLAASLLVVGATGCGSLLDLGGPWELRGPKFLTLFAALFAGVWLAALFFRFRASRTVVPNSDSADDDLTPYEAAHLEGKDKRAVACAVASLVQRGHLRNRPFHKRQLELREPLPEDAPPLDRAIVATVEDYAGASFRDLLHRGNVRRECRALDEALVSKGLLLPAARASGVRLLTAGLFFLLLLFGMSKIYVGVERGRPVGFLIAFCVVTAICGVVFLLWPLRKTHRARAALQKLKAAHRFWGRRGRVELTTPALTVAWAVALFSPEILRRSYLDSVATDYLAPPPSPGGSGTGHGGASSCGSGCGGGGGGGCGGGGCGGGGCGGCGGG